VNLKCVIASIFRFQLCHMLKLFPFGIYYSGHFQSEYKARGGEIKHFGTCILMGDPSIFKMLPPCHLLHKHYQSK
jgi:hypothetical protein